MKERPILFSTSMVQAILDGRKTQTRRIMKIQPCFSESMGKWVLYPKQHPAVYADMINADKYCPYGQPGDVLWVRETWNITDPNDCIPGEYLGPRTSYTGSGPNGDILWRYVYKATSPESHPDSKKGKCRWKSPLFMPREACRIKLEITDIRVERLQDISEEDAKAEGVKRIDNYKTHVWEYETLWESINGKGSWEKNSWVWVITFKKL